MRGPAIGQLLERGEELGRIESALADARAGRGAFVVVEGPAGIGKTALLAAARTAAADAGMRVLRSRGTELERDFAFGVVRQLFEPALAAAPEAERADLLQAAAGVAAAVLGLPGAAGTSGPLAPVADPSFAVLHGLYWLCANLAAASPLCLVVDDAHWADASSLRYLAFLLPRLEELDAALVVATRPREPGTDADLLAAVTTDPSADVISVPPLSRAAVGDLVASRLGAAPHPAFVDACLRATRGTPFFMRLLVDALSEGQLPPTADAARDVERIGARTVGRSIGLRLRRLPEHAGRLARALSVLEQGDLIQAAQLAGLDEPEAADAAERLMIAGILEPGPPLAFTHPIVRGGIYSELSGAERAQAHRGAARLLADRPGGGERVAKHLLACEPAGDDWVVDRLVEAARAAGRQGAPDSQATFLRRALAEPPPAGDRSALLLDLGMAEASAGHADWVEHLQGAVDSAPTAAAAADAALVLADALSGAHRYREVVEVLDRAVGRLDAGDSALALRLEAAAAIAEMNDPPASGARRGAALRERAASDPAAPREILGPAAFSSASANEPATAAAELASRALGARGTAPRDSGPQPWFLFSGWWFSHATFALLWTERHARLRPLLDGSIAQAQATGDSSRLAMGLLARGWLALRCGDLRAAEADTRTALAATELSALLMFRVMSAGVLIEALVEQGELDDAEHTVAEFGEATETGTLIAAVPHFARSRLRVAQGRVAEALEDFLAVGAILTRAQVLSSCGLAWRSQAALAHLALGDRDAAERLAGEELDIARAFGTPRALGVAMRAAGVVAGGRRGEALLREAVAALERGEATLERAHALTDLGAMIRRHNRRTEARGLLREALDAAHRSGAKPLARRAETELRATGARPRRVVLTGLDSLTASERRIAELAGQGLTNREIAQTLFVTARTVEGHLTSVFRKLLVDSRDELPAALTGGAPVPV